MSSQSSFVSVPSSQVGDAQAADWVVSHVASVYRATPVAVADTETQGFLIDAYGRLVTIGAAADSAPVFGNPNWMAGKYNLAAPTYADGDLASFQMDAAGQLRVVDAGVATLLTTLNGYVDGLEGFVDGLEGLITTTNSTLTTIDGRVDGLEALITTLNGYADGLETLIGTTNSNLSTMIGHVDGLEGLITTLNGYVDGLEGYTDGIEALLTTLNTYAGPRTVFSPTYKDYSSTNLPGNASNPLELVASLGSTCRKIQVFDTGGVPFELMTGAAAAETRLMVLGPGVDTELEVNISSGTRVSVRRLDSASALTGGVLCINFLS